MPNPSHIAFFASTQGAYGGVEAHVLALAKLLHNDAEYTVEIVFKCVRGHSIQKQLIERCEETKVPHKFVRRGSLDILRAIIKADVVHVNNAPPDVVIPAKIFGKPIIATIHHQGKTNNVIRRVLWRLSARWATIRCYNTNFVRKAWESNFTQKGSYTAPTCSELPEAEINFEARKGFFFIGRWIENKGIRVLIQAYAQAKLDPQKWPLYLAGEGPLRSWAEAYIDDHKILGVHVLGFLSEEKKWKYIRKAKWIVTPPHTLEDQGLTPIEGRSQAVPSIITLDGGLPEAAGNTALTCEPNNIDALASALREASLMLEDNYKKRARECYRSLSDYLKPLDFYKKLYSTVLRKGSTIP